MDAVQRNGSRIALWSVLALSVGFYLAWEIAHRGVFAYAQTIYPISDADEWRYTACSRLVGHGYAIFNQVFSAQPPLLFLTLAGGMRVAGDSIDGARWVEIAFGLLAMGAVAWFAASLSGRKAAPLAAALLAVSPGFLVYSHAVEAEVPMMALGALSLALLAFHYSRPSPAIAAAAGLALAAAILFKFFAVVDLLPGCWLILAASRPLGARLRSAAVFGAATAVPVVLELAAVSPQRQWQQVISMHDRAASLDLPGSLSAFGILRRFLELDAGLTLLALLGLVVLTVRRRRVALGAAGSWLLGTALMLLLFRPLFPHHAAILTAPLAATGATGLAAAWDLGAGRGRAAVLVAAVVLYALFLPRLIHDDRHVLEAQSSPATSALARFVDSRTPPSDFVAADDLQVADLANRLVPPWLCDPSNVRRLSGYLTAGDLISATRQYHPKLVVASASIYVQVPGYLAWVRRSYRRVTAPADAPGAQIYARR